MAMCNYIGYNIDPSSRRLPLKRPEPMLSCQRTKTDYNLAKFTYLLSCNCFLPYRIINGNKLILYLLYSTLLYSTLLYSTLICSRSLNILE